MLLDRLDELDLRLHDLRGDRGAPGRRPGASASTRAATSSSRPRPYRALGRGGGRRGRVGRRRPPGAPRARDRARLRGRTTAGWPRTGREDFGLSIVRALELLRAHPDRREAARAGARHVLVDEFQDTNHAQAELLYAGRRRAPTSLMVVGDDDQGIYRFRGASAKNITDFRRRFPERRRAAAGAQPPLHPGHPRRRDGRRGADRRPRAQDAASRCPRRGGPAAARSGARPTPTARPARWSTAIVALAEEGVPARGAGGPDARGAPGGAAAGRGARAGRRAAPGARRHRPLRAPRGARRGRLAARRVRPVGGAGPPARRRRPALRPALGASWPTR